jgi:hypothetical protein
VAEPWEEHDEVHHYTTLSGLKGILETQTLHATHFGFLNDPTEIYQLRARLVATVLPITTKFHKDAAAANQQAKMGMAAAGGIPSVAARDAARLVEVAPVVRTDFPLR